MFGIFMESFVMLKLYTGLKLLLLLSFLSWGYLLIKEREKRVRILLVYVPVIILGLFLFPVSRKLFVAAGRGDLLPYPLDHSHGNHRLLWSLLFFCTAQKDWAGGFCRADYFVRELCV